MSGYFVLSIYLSGIDIIFYTPHVVLTGCIILIICTHIFMTTNLLRYAHNINNDNNIVKGLVEKANGKQSAFVAILKQLVAKYPASIKTRVVEKKAT